MFDKYVAFKEGKGNPETAAIPRAELIDLIKAATANEIWIFLKSQPPQTNTTVLCELIITGQADILEMMADKKAFISKSNSRVGPLAEPPLGKIKEPSDRYALISLCTDCMAMPRLVDPISKDNYNRIYQILLLSGAPLFFIEGTKTEHYGSLLNSLCIADKTSMDYSLTSLKKKNPYNLRDAYNDPDVRKLLIQNLGRNTNHEAVLAFVDHVFKTAFLLDAQPPLSANLKKAMISFVEDLTTAASIKGNSELKKELESKYSYLYQEEKPAQKQDQENSTNPSKILIPQKRQAIKPTELPQKQKATDNPIFNTTLNWETYILPCLKAMVEAKEVTFPSDQDNERLYRCMKQSYNAYKSVNTYINVNKESQFFNTQTKIESFKNSVLELYSKQPIVPQATTTPVTSTANPNPLQEPLYAYLFAAVPTGLFASLSTYELLIKHFLAPVLIDANIKTNATALLGTGFIGTSISIIACKYPLFGGFISTASIGTSWYLGREIAQNPLVIGCHAAIIMLSGIAEYYRPSGITLG